MSEHAEVNIRTPGLYAGASDINKTVISRNITKYQPRSINNNNTASATVPNITGQVEFQFTTSNNQWTDLFNSFFLSRLTIGGPGANPGVFRHVTQNLISQAYFYINGVQCAFTNNWTVASKINKRIQFSKQYNETVHSMNYQSDCTIAVAALAEAMCTAGGNGAAGAGCNYAIASKTLPVATVAGTFTDKEYLDGFFIRDRDSCWVPPNSEIRIVLVADPSYPLKAVRTNGAAVNSATLLVNSIEFVTASVIKADPVPTDYTLKLITNSITTSLVTADCNRQLTVDPNIVKVAIAFQAQNPINNAINKTWGGEVLSYPTQTEKTDGSRALTGTQGIEALSTLQLQLGSIVNPAQAYDFATNLHREAYEQYMHLTGKTLNYENQESFLDWLTEPIFLFDFPRPVQDKSTNLTVRGTRLAPALTPQMHIVEMDEQLINFKYDPTTSACISTTTLK
jgi:hypothetical protein